ncbi:50S ribosomal protein L7ae-like protein [Streptomyces gulbargensis]|uniref:50S ribosomal protein L7ae-like protein n=1 Tax=Streptomyces gulbargensis TaxID=364901 RepID=A0ABP7NIU9_9ACTN
MKAIQKGNVVEVFVAIDADQLIVNPVIDSAKQHDVPIEYVQSKNELGKACGIDVLASAVGIIREK